MANQQCGPNGATNMRDAETVSSYSTKCRAMTKRKHSSLSFLHTEVKWLTDKPASSCQSTSQDSWHQNYPALWGNGSLLISSSIQHGSKHSACMYTGERNNCKPITIVIYNTFTTLFYPCRNTMAVSELVPTVTPEHDQMWHTWTESLIRHTWTESLIWHMNTCQM